MSTANGPAQPDEFLVHTLKAMGSLMLIRVYRAVDGTLRAHWETGGTHIPSAPQNRHFSRPDWDF